MTTIRFAASPRGRLDLGNARVAVANFLLARKSGGRFLLRLDDTDRDRSEKRFTRAIETDMAWLGLDWDLFARQSDRLALYAGAAERLKAAGRLYPSFATEEQPPDWRFKLAEGPVAWDDLIGGRVTVTEEKPADPVLLRADDTPLAIFASVVDDIEFEITQVILGEDHVALTAVQLQIFAALGFSPPAFAHFPLPIEAQQIRSYSIEALREEGIEPMAIDSLLAKLGTCDAIEPRLRLDELVAEFDLAKFGRVPPRFDPAELARLNAGLLHAMSYEAAAHRLPAGAGCEFWEAVRPSLARFADVAHWWTVCRGALAPEIAPEDATLLAEAAALLPEEPFDAATWDRWVAALDSSGVRDGKALRRLLRRALTAQEEADLRHLLPLIGRERALRRLRGETA